MADHTVQAEAPESTLPYPPIHLDKRFVVLTDWDGTVTTFDSNDFLTDNYGMGFKRRRALHDEMLAGTNNFRDAFREELDSVAENHTFEECAQLLRENIKLDNGFKPFIEWCKVNDVPVVIVSSGIEPWIRACISKLIGDDEAAHIDVVSNNVQYKPDGKWQIKYRHPSSGYGHDKSQAILPYRQLPEPPLLFFFGDGVSDLSAARHADILFVKTKEDGENDLAKYCNREGIPHVLFSSFSGALDTVRRVVNGELSKGDVLKLGTV